jgi:hypothetical protein
MSGYLYGKRLAGGKLGLFAIGRGTTAVQFQGENKNNCLSYTAHDVIGANVSMPLSPQPLLRRTYVQTCVAGSDHGVKAIGAARWSDCCKTFTPRCSNGTNEMPAFCLARRQSGLDQINWWMGGGSYTRNRPLPLVGVVRVRPNNGPHKIRSGIYTCFELHHFVLRVI